MTTGAELPGEQFPRGALGVEGMMLVGLGGGGMMLVGPVLVLQENHFSWSPRG